MARPFTHVSSRLYYELEVYFFKLALYTDSDEYAELPVKSRNKIDHEINSIDAILNVMRMFRQIPTEEKAVIGRKQFNEDEEKYNRVFRFSSPIVASKCLGINVSHIVAVCKRKRPTAGGYIFQYEEEYETPIRERKKWYEY